MEWKNQKSDESNYKMKKNKPLEQKQEKVNKHFEIIKISQNRSRKKGKQ